MKRKDGFQHLVLGAPHRERPWQGGGGVPRSSLQSFSGTTPFGGRRIWGSGDFPSTPQAFMETGAWALPLGNRSRNVNGGISFNVAGNILLLAASILPKQLEMLSLNVGQFSNGSARQGIAFVIILLLIQRLWIFVYRIFFHPLAKYPGPTAAKITSLYMTAFAATGKATYKRYDLHRKYGSVIRTGPNELCFADLHSIKDIYGQSTEPCPKAPFFYDGFTLTGTHSVFSSTDRTEHARMRRLLSHGLSQQGVLKFKEEIVGIIKQFTGRVRASSQVVDIHDLVHHLYLDITSQLSFAKSFHILEGAPQQGSKDIETYFSIAPLFGVFPITKYLPFGLFRAARETRPRIIKFVQTCIDDFRERVRFGTSQSGLLRLMVEAKDGETNTAFSDEELIENAVIFIIAGSGTTASTLLYLIYEMGKRPEMQKRLEEEIRTQFPDPSVFPDFDAAASLVCLQFSSENESLADIGTAISQSSSSRGSTSLGSNSHRSTARIPWQDHWR